MKANRKAILNDEEAVSPVIAVILMVAITVVLAATVFVLVNELGQDVGQTGPTLGMTTASGTGGGEWNIRITSATQSSPLTEYTVILNTADHGTKSAQWNADEGARFWDTEAAPAITADCYRLTSITGGDNLAVGERYVLEYDGDPATDCNTDGFADADDLGTGTYEIEFIHRPTGTSAGSLSRDF